jgi:hypothetical protein
MTLHQAALSQPHPHVSSIGKPQPIARSQDEPNIPAPVSRASCSVSESSEYCFYALADNYGNQGKGGRAYRYVRGGSFDFSFRKAAAGSIPVDLLFDPPTDLATTRRSVRVVGGSSSLVVRVNRKTMRVAMSRAWL